MVVLSFPVRNCSKIKKRFAGNRKIEWVYLGKDFFKMKELERTLGERFRRINISKISNEVTNEIRIKHVHWVDELNRHHGNSIDWWVGSVASRDIYSSNLFQYCCYLEVLKRLLIQGDQKPALVFVESVGLAKTMKRWAAINNIGVDMLHCGWMWPPCIKHYSRIFFIWAGFIITQVVRSSAALISGRRYGMKNFRERSSTVVDTFVHDQCLDDTGNFRDRYYPYLYEFFEKHGVHVIVHPVLFGFSWWNYFSVYNRMRRSKTCFILQEDFLQLSDYLYAFGYPVRAFMTKITSIPFLDNEMSDILNEENRTQIYTSALQAILIYRLFLRLGEAGMRFRVIIDWYENQNIDKALIAGARRAFPATKVLGSQMFIQSPNSLNLFPSQSEVDAKITPDILLETSQYQCARAQMFTKDIPAIPAAALRNAYFFEDCCGMACGPSQQGNAILVLMPSVIGEAIELLHVLKDGLNQMPEDVHILLKGHPDYDSKELIDLFGKGNWPSRFKLFQEELVCALSSATVVISSNTSSMVEAAAKGIPVVVVGRQSALNHNMLSNLNMDIMTECFSTGEVVDAVTKYLNMALSEPDRYKQIGSAIRDIFFTPVCEKTMLPFLAIEGESNAS